VTGLLLLLLAGRGAQGLQIDLRVKGQMAKVYTAREPLFVVNSLAEAKARWAEVRELLPPPPFIMDGQWVVRLDADGPRTWADKAETAEVFSPNGDYVVTVEYRKTAEGLLVGQRERLWGLDGRLYWDRERRLGKTYVLDSGRVLDCWREFAEGPGSFEVIERDTGQVVRREIGTFQLPQITACPRAGLLVFADYYSVAALDNRGEPVWRWSGQEVRDQVGSFVPIAGEDPLGRGVHVMAMAHGKGVAIVLLDALTGRLNRVLVPYRGPMTLLGLSPRGTMAAIQTAGGVGLIDWASGEVLFAHSKADRVDGIEVICWSTSVTVSDGPGRLAAHLNSGDTVFDRSGRVVWRNYLHADSPKRLVLASDGRQLGAVSWDLDERSRDRTVSSVVAYGLPADGQTMPGL
jgi:hypothetical protein